MWQKKFLSSSMDEYSGRKGVDGLAVPKRGSCLIPRELNKSRDQNIQLCNRIGCSGRLNPARSAPSVSFDKRSVLKSSSGCSKHVKDIAVNSSKGVPKVTNPVKPMRAFRNKLTSSSETDSSASSGNPSSDLQKAEVANSNASSGAVNASIGVTKVSNPAKPLRGLRNKLPSSSETDSSASSGNPSSDPLQEDEVENSSPSSEATRGSVHSEQKESQSGDSRSMAIGNRGAITNARSKRTYLKKPASVVDSTVASSTGSGASRSTPQISRQNASAARPRSRYIRCSSAPNVTPAESASSNRKQMLKRSSEGESSSSRVNQPTLTEHARPLGLRSSASISETRQARSAQTSFRDNVSTSVRARRSDTSTAHRPPQMSRQELPTDQRMHRLPNSVSATGYPLRAHNFTRPSTTESSRSGNLTSHEGFRRYNINGIAEMLLALDQIEHDDEMSFERLLALESNFFHGGLSFHDQYRDMRLDIDDMSYEELLALEERMGSVSTALSEEAIAKCIKKSYYKPISLVADSSCLDGREEDTKCSICQEEYNIGDEMGRLHCNHSYHADCIDRWLWQKSCCPICKSDASSSSS